MNTMHHAEPALELYTARCPVGMQLTNNVKAVFPALKVNLCLLANSHNLYSNAQCLQLFIALLRLRESKIQIQMMHASFYMSILSCKAMHDASEGA